MYSLFLLFGLEGNPIIKYASIGTGALALILIVLAIVVGVKSKKADKASTESQPEPETAPVAQPEPQPVVQEEVKEEPAPVETQPEVKEEPVEEIKEPETTPEPVEEVKEEVVEEPVVEEVEEQPAPVEEIKEEPKQEVAAVVAETSDDDDDDKDNDNDDEAEDDAPVRSVAKIDGHVRYIIIKYNKSFTAKIIQSDDSVKNYYSELKNELLSYKGVKARMSWKGETFYAGRTTYAKICVRGKKLALFLALDAVKYEDSKYNVEDMSDVATYEKTPCLYRIKNDRRLKYSKELIQVVMGDRERMPDDSQTTDWAKEYPYEEIEPLVKRGLVKVLTTEDAQSGDVFKPRDSVQSTEVDELMQDDIAEALIEENDEISDKTKTDIVNIDTLSYKFEDGETVTLEEMKKRIPSIDKKATYIKVLARGTLDKKLTVIADSFSIQAVKMILLTGGNAIKKKNS